VPTEAKAKRIEEIRTRLGQVRAAVLTEYRGLSVRDLSELRRQLRGVHAEYRVVKNRLARIAVEGSPLAPLRVHLRGPIGVVIGRRDPVAVAKTLSTFARTAPTLQVRVGVIDGQLLLPDGLRAVAELPSQAVIRAHIVGAVQGPLAQLVGLLAAAQRELAYILAQRGKGIQEPRDAGSAGSDPGPEVLSGDGQGHPADGQTTTGSAGAHAPST
jgi:ribosomal protein L10